MEWQRQRKTEALGEKICLGAILSITNLTNTWLTYITSHDWLRTSQRTQCLSSRKTSFHAVPEFRQLRKHSTSSQLFSEDKRFFSINLWYQTPIQGYVRFCGSHSGDYDVTIFWNATPCSLIDMYRLSTKPYRGTNLLRNIHVYAYTVYIHTTTWLHIDAY